MLARLTCLLAIGLALLAATAAQAEPETVHFESTDGATHDDPERVSVSGNTVRPLGPDVQA